MSHDVMAFVEPAALTGDVALAALDVLPDHLAVLDGSGTIIFTNAAWRRFAHENSWDDPSPAIGWNYLAVCEAAAADEVPEAAVVAAEIREICSSAVGADDADPATPWSETFLLNDDSGELYPCHSPVEERWFRVSVSRLPVPGPVRILVRHANVTARQQDRVSAALAERQYRQVFLAGGDAIVVTDALGRVLDANPAASAAIAMPLPLLRQWRLSDVLEAAGSASKDVPGVLDDPAIESDEGWRGELRLRSSNGAVIPVEAVVTSVTSTSEQLVIWVLRDVSARHQLAQMQRDFIGMVSHELKGPLTGLKGYAQLMARSQRYDQRAVDAMLQQSRVLDRLINDLVELTRSETGQLRITRERVDLDALVTSLVEQTRQTTDKHTLELSLPDEPVIATVDQTRISQVLLNLLTNAVKYSPDGGAIDVRLEMSDDIVSVSIRDEGAGIAPELLPRLFDRYFRVPGYLQNTVPGLGIGLYISKTIVEAHGGAVLVSSTAGSGSTFTVQLPVEPVR